MKNPAKIKCNDRIEQMKIAKPILLNSNEKIIEKRGGSRTYGMKQNIK